MALDNSSVHSSLHTPLPALQKMTSASWTSLPSWVKQVCKSISQLWPKSLLELLSTSCDILQTIFPHVLRLVYYYSSSLHMCWCQGSCCNGNSIQGSCTASTISLLFQETDAVTNFWTGEKCLLFPEGWNNRLLSFTITYILLNNSLNGKGINEHTCIDILETF